MLENDLQKEAEMLDQPGDYSSFLINNYEERPSLIMKSRYESIRDDNPMTLTDKQIDQTYILNDMTTLSLHDDTQKSGGYVSTIKLMNNDYQSQVVKAKRVVQHYADGSIYKG